MGPSSTYRLTVFSPSRHGLFNSKLHALPLSEICSLLKPTWLFSVHVSAPLIECAVFLSACFCVYFCTHGCVPLSPPLRSKCSRWPWLSTGATTCCMHSGGCLLHWSQACLGQFTVPAVSAIMQEANEYNLPCNHSFALLPSSVLDLCYYRILRDFTSVSGCLMRRWCIMTSTSSKQLNER